MSCFVCGRNSQKRLPGFVQIRRIQQRRDQNERLIIMGIIISLFFAETEKSSDGTETVNSLPPTPALINPEKERPTAHHAVLQVSQAVETLSIDFVLHHYDTIQCNKTYSNGKLYFATPPVEIQGRHWWLNIFRDGDRADATGGSANGDVHHSEAHFRCNYEHP